MTESPIEEIHRVRRDISERFDGDINRIADDAAERLLKTGRPIWQPKAVTFFEPSSNESRLGIALQPSSVGGDDRNALPTAQQGDRAPQT